MKPLNICLSVLILSLSACQILQQDSQIRLPQDSQVPLPQNSVISLPESSQTTQMISGKRVALIIGNADYKVAPLNNPTNDAMDMANTLKQLGFKVIHLNNASWEEMDKGLEEFSQELGPDTVGLFFFSGHGVQFEGNNYLLPTDLEKLTARHVKHRSMTATYVLTAMKEAKNTMNIIILDACRDNPFKGGTKGLTKGLARLDLVPKGTLIAYATSPGDVAADGMGRNSPYTKHILKFIRQPALPIELMFKRVRNSVMAETSGEQTPWETNSLIGNDFYFAGEDEGKKEPLPIKSNIEIERLKKENARLINLSQLAVKKVETLRKELQKNTEKQAKPISDKQIKGFRDKLKNGGVGPEMVWIPAGHFQMGDQQDKGGSDELPVHLVSITRFAMGRYEVTFEEYDKFAEFTTINKPSDNGWGRGNYPVIHVSWEDAVAYTKWLSQQTGKQYRLPTEAEWEYSARAGTATEYWWSNKWAKKANCNQDYNQTTQVDSFDPNPFGLFDILGNVYEWLADPWHPNYEGAPSKGQIWVGQSKKRLLRGGSWFSSSSYCRAANRNKYALTEGGDSVGFRVALSH
ncbi:MAG: SUMF1/EgtB/PvdO family nonheme iron enzyme [Thiotrichaceae bacterium]|nr:SUMF1/EgtB/PvdO family nonheme iron enzyme [Thiotrichaceae bacterium]